MAIRFHDFPPSIQLQTHTKCNLACVMCPHPALAMNEQRTRLSWEGFTKIVDECHEHPTFRSFVLDLQNEPLLDHQLDERIAYIKKTSSGRTFVGITTNGVLLTKERAERLFASGIDTVVVSANATTRETYNELVPGDFFSRLEGNLKACLELPGAREKLLFSFGYSGENRHELEEFVRNARGERLRHRVFPLHDRLGLVRGPRFLPIVAPRSCRTPLEGMAILANGDVVLCCQDWTRARVMGNILSSSIADVWRSAEYTAIRDGALTGSLPDNPCAKCKHPVVATPLTSTLWELQRASPRFFDVPQAAVDPGSALAAPAARFVLLPEGARYVVVDTLKQRSLPLTADAAFAFEVLRAGTTQEGLVAACMKRLGDVEEAEVAAWVAATLDELTRMGLFEERVPSLADVPAVVFSVNGKLANLLDVDEGGQALSLGLKRGQRLAAGTSAALVVRVANQTAMIDVQASVVGVDESRVTFRIDDADWPVMRMALETELSGHPLFVSRA